MIEFIGAISEEDLAKADKETIGMIKSHALVRCKDCRWHNGKINQCNAQICASMYGDDFCSRAERKGGD